MLPCETSNQHCPRKALNAVALGLTPGKEVKPSAIREGQVTATLAYEKKTSALFCAIGAPSKDQRKEGGEGENTGECQNYKIEPVALKQEAIK
jgi:hypothetical protein